jgi:hypothetical protein
MPNAENGLPECNCDSMGGRFGSHRPECPWQVAYEAQLIAEKDALTEVERRALVRVLCDLTYRGRQLTPAHARALVKHIEPVVVVIVETRTLPPGGSDA